MTPAPEGLVAIELDRSDQRLWDLLTSEWGRRFGPTSAAVGLLAGKELIAAGCYARHEPDATLLHSAVVRTDHRGRGLHRWLVRARLDRADAAGRPTCYACAHELNGAAIRGFLDNGFVRCPPRAVEWTPFPTMIAES
jgi:GNAT superfamily N-acetyltransferase